MFGAPDWHQMFSPSMSLFELFFRGSLVYFFIFFLLRIVRREAGTLSVADVLVLVLVADAAQNGMAGDYMSVPEAMVLVGTIVFWSLVIDWAGYEFPVIGRLLHPPAVELVRDGMPLLPNMRRNLISRDELMTAVHEAGADDLTKVRRAWLEGNGEIAVILREESQAAPAPA